MRTLYHRLSSLWTNIRLNRALARSCHTYAKRQEAEIKRLKERNASLLVAKLLLTIELETIADNPDSEQAKKIIAKYQERIMIRKEQDLSGQN